MAIALGGTSAYAGTLETVTVRVAGGVGKARREINYRCGHSRGFTGYRVNAADLDLASSAGKAELEKRVQAAANAACKELDRLTFGDPTRSDDARVKKAADGAMATVR